MLEERGQQICYGALFRGEGVQNDEKLMLHNQYIIFINLSEFSKEFDKNASKYLSSIKFSLNVYDSYRSGTIKNPQAKYLCE